MFKQQKGITLIALVITIIVLLILAGVTIAMLSGNDSTPKKANEAAAKDAVASMKDQINLKAVDALTTFYDTTYVQNASADGKKAVAGQTVAAAINKEWKNYTKTPINGVKFTTIPEEKDGEYSYDIKITSTKDTSVSCKGTIQANGGIEWEDIKVATK